MSDGTRITLSKAQLASMSRDELSNLLLTATKVEATAVVIRKDGSIRYDDPSKAGTYGEQYLTGEKRDG